MIMQLDALRNRATRPLAELQVAGAHQRQAVVGPWRLTCCLGRGRWSSVYAASPAEYDREWPAQFALKILDRSRCTSSRATSSLQREAAVMQAARHPRIAALLDAQLSHDTPYVVTPRIAGVTLSKLLSADVPSDVDFALPLHRSLWVVRQTAEAIRHLHEVRWLHGDVNPSNVMVSPRGEVTLIDYSCARRLDGEESIHDGWTQSHAEYHAPEMRRPGIRITAAADVYSLGVMIAHLVSRQPSATVDRNHQLPTEWLRLLTAMLAEDPRHRPTSEEVVDELLALEISLL